MCVEWILADQKLLDNLQVNVRELTTCSDPNQYATPSAKADFKVPGAAPSQCNENDIPLYE